MVLGLVALSVAEGVLVAKPQAQIGQPAIVLNGLADPNRTRVIGMCLFIGNWMQAVWIQNPVGTVEELGGFKYHLDDMFVAMRLGGFARDQRKDEDIHDDNFTV
jgi:hypothetical protein